MSSVQVGSPDEWAVACSSAFVPLTATSSSPAFRATLAQRRLTEDVALTRVASDASEVARDRATIAQNPRESVLISLHRTGTGDVRQHGRVARMRSGSAVLYDTSVPYVLAFPAAMSEIVLQLPRSAITATGHAFDDLTGRTLPEGRELAILHALASAASHEHPGTLEFERTALAEALVAAAHDALSAGGAGRGATDPRVVLLSLREYIVARCADPHLTPERVAAAHHLSLRQAQKLFAQDGDAPAAFLRRTRLDRAKGLLEGGARVGEAARASGFYDVDSFTRAFRTRFGAVPSSVSRHTEAA